MIARDDRSGDTQRRRTLDMTRVLLAVALAAACVVASSARQTVFRSTVDVIAVDVQVVDGDGNPIGRIGPDSFQVSINGQRRKVVSAQFISHAAGHDDPAEPRPPEGRGRTFILAIDSGSFEVGAERGPIEGAQSFVQHLDANDRIGLFVYPHRHPDRSDDPARTDHISAWARHGTEGSAADPLQPAGRGRSSTSRHRCRTPNSFLTAAAMRRTLQQQMAERRSNWIQC